MSLSVRILSLAPIFILPLRFPPGKSLVTILVDLIFAFSHVPSNFLLMFFEYYMVNR